MTDLKDDVETVAHNVADEVETVAHNAAHPGDETDKEARKRQPWMPIIGSILVAIGLFICYAYFYK